MLDYGSEEDWNWVYQELCQTIGKKSTLELYQAYKGIQITLPMRLISANKLKKVLEREYKNYSRKELAKIYGYSERHINRVIHEIKKKEDEEK